MNKTVRCGRYQWRCKLGFLLGFILISMLFLACEPDTECLQDPDCVAGKTNWMTDADNYCAPYIESWAAYDYRWTDGWLDSKFDRVGVIPPKYETLRYTGSEIQFQNGFGAWMRQNYECVYDPINKNVVSVDVW